MDENLQSKVWELEKKIREDNKCGWDIHRDHILVNYLLGEIIKLKEQINLVKSQ